MIFWQNYMYAANFYDFPSPKQQAQFNGLLKDLRCLVCQNQDLADSNADLAKDLRQQIYQMILNGQSDQEVIAYMRERYGDFILFKPIIGSLTYFLWFGPLIFVGLGLLVFWRLVFVKKNV